MPDSSVDTPDSEQSTTRRATALPAEISVETTTVSFAEPYPETWIVFTPTGNGSYTEPPPVKLIGPALERPAVYERTAGKSENGAVI